MRGRLDTLLLGALTLLIGVLTYRAFQQEQTFDWLAFGALLLSLATLLKGWFGKRTRERAVAEEIKSRVDIVLEEVPHVAKYHGSFKIVNRSANRTVHVQDAILRYQLSDLTMGEYPALNHTLEPGETIHIPEPNKLPLSLCVVEMRWGAEDMSRWEHLRRVFVHHESGVWLSPEDWWNSLDDEAKMGSTKPPTDIRLAGEEA